MLLSRACRCQPASRAWTPARDSLQPRRSAGMAAAAAAPPPAAAAVDGPESQAANLGRDADEARRDLDRLQQDVERKFGIPRSIYEEAGGKRVRQHVNPLKKELQIPTDPPAWDASYSDPARPLVLDVGCGYGRFLLALTSAMPGHNGLGLEIREPIIERANKWAASLGLERSVLFLRGNATITLDHTLASYPGQLDLVCVQFPDPHFKARHKKRRTVQRQFVEALSRLLAPGARVFLQSDVLEAAEHMRDTFEQHGSPWFAPCQEAHSRPTFHAASEPRPAQGAQQQQRQEAQEQHEGQQAIAAEVAGAAGGEGARAAEEGQPPPPQQQAEEPRWTSQWAAAGWLCDNPLGVPTEREVLTSAQGLPIYRVMLRRTAAEAASS